MTQDKSWQNYEIAMATNLFFKLINKSKIYKYERTWTTWFLHLSACWLADWASRLKCLVKQ